MPLPRTVIPFAAAVLAVAALAAQPAAAQTATADNVTLVNQDRALAGLGGGDAPGFPVLIARSGTYRLTSNLVVPAGVDAIQVQDGVNAVIDLNGFNIVGPAVCSSTVACYSIDGTTGVSLLGDNAYATVTNGRIRGFSRAAVSYPGIYWTGAVTADNLRLERNGYGILVRDVVATRLTMAENTGAGLWAISAQVSDSHAHHNGGSGLSFSSGSVRNTRSFANLGYGFATGARVVLQGNTAEANKQGAANGGVIVPGSNAF